MRAAFSRLRCPANNQDLILTGCSVDVTIVDVHASVVLSQRFQNPLANLALAATYTFGMLAGAAICGFEMIRQDGTKVEGIVKEKDEAKKEYGEAVSQGKTASLGEEQTKDVFSVSVGNILPSETVTINLRFLQPLIDDEKRDQIRFMFPQTYAQRYGQAPSMEAATASTAHQPFEMKMTLQQAGPIKSVACPSGHSISFEFGPPEGSSAVDASHFATVTLREPYGFLKKDVLIVITAANLDSPRCFVEPHPSPNHPSTAVELTLVPRFNLPDVDGGMEYIFLVDRSGSMRGQNIKLVQEALVVLLRGLPTKDTSFNIVSFGTKSTKLWDQSKRYTQQTLDHATKHIDSMAADYRGTKIASALQTVFGSLQKPLTKPVAVLLLTDGGAWDVVSCVQHVENALRDLPGNGTFIRVFTVGIGEGASTDTCDSIARAGNGMALYVSAGEPLTGKCSRLIRAARTPPVTDLQVLWPAEDNKWDVSSVDDDFEMVDEKEAIEKLGPPTSVNLFQQDLDETTTSIGPPPKPTLPSPPGIQQAPITIQNLFPGTRTHIYAILSESVFAKGSTFPSSLKVRGKVQTTGVPVELDVPVTKLLISQSNRWHPILHTLTAKALITDREGGNHAFPASLAAQFEKDLELKSMYLEQEIIRLGTTYSLTSKHTSFVAVDRVHTDQKLVQVLPPTVGHLAPSPLPHWHGHNCRTRSQRGTKRVAIPAPPNVSAPRPRPESDLQSRSPYPLSGAPQKRSLARPVMARDYMREAPAPPSRAKRASLSIRAPTAESDSSVQSRTLLSSGPRPKGRAFSRWDSIDISSDSSDGDDGVAPEVGAQSLTANLDPGERLVAIARLQQFDGGFKLSASLLQLLGTSVTAVSTVKERFKAAGLGEDVGSTLLALMWLRRNSSDEVLDMIDKAEQWIKDKIGDGMPLEELAQQISNLIPFTNP